MEEFKVL